MSVAPPTKLVDRVDLALYRAERALCITVLAAMVSLVGLEVIQRIFTRPGGNPSKMEELMLRILRHPSGSWARDWAAPLMLLVFGFGVVYAALRQRTLKAGESQPSRGVALLIAGATTGVLGGLLYLLAAKVPSFSWPHGLALALMVWVGFLGASLATYDRRHLALEMGSKIWPKKWLPAIGGLSRLVTTAFCVFFAYLAWKSMLGHKADDDRFLFGIQLFDIPEEPWRMPEWIAYAAIPYAFFVMSLRFIKQAVLVFGGANLEAGSDLPQALVEEAGMTSSSGDQPAELSGSGPAAKKAGDK